MAYQKVAIAGATGHIGQPILDALIASGQFSITVLTRQGRETPISAGVKKVEIDYDNVNNVADALQGQEVVISALNSASMAQQDVLIEASVRAGVKRIIPSQFGSNTLNPHAAKLPVFSSKKKMEQKVEELAAQNRISYTYIMNGPFLDFGLAAGFMGVDLKKKQLSYLDGGNTKFTTTTLKTVAKVVVGVLMHPEETKNRAVFVQEAAVTQRDLLRISKQTLGDDGWTEVDDGSTAELERSTYDKLARGEKSMDVFVGFLLCAMLREGYGGLFSASKLDNELFGVTELKESDIAEIVQAITKA